MNKIIDTIVKIDKKAADTVADAQAYADEVLANVSAEAESMKKEASDEIDRQISEYDGVKRREFDEKCAAAKSENELRVARMHALYDEKRTQWVNDYYADIISLD